MSTNSNSTSPASVAAALRPLEEDDYGPLLGSTLVTYALWGILYMQVYNYFSSDLSTKDRLFVRIMIGIAAILECWLTFVFTHMTYFYLVYNFGDPAVLAIRPWSENIMFVSRETQIFIVRCLFLHRLFVLSRGNMIITGWILLWSLLQLGSGVAITVLFFGFGVTLTLPKSLYTTVYIAQASVMVADISLIAALCYYLNRSRTGFKRTDSLIQLFIVYGISSTALVFVFAIVALALFLAFGHNFLSYPFATSQTKFYFISYMVTVNRRETIRNRNQREETESINLPAFTNASTQIHSGSGGLEKPTIACGSA